jgi:outer membrane lipoprotein-sorting protein
MRARLTKSIAAFAVIGALAVGGATLASAGSKAAPVQPPASLADVQQGDQSAPDAAATAEQSSESESSEQIGESSSEAAASDGPGGYADSNANADSQFQGEQ